jgi:hypothetical protein
MSVYICGDTHFGIDHHKITSKNWTEQRKLTKEDYLIVAGDFGLLWDMEQTKQEKYLTRELQARKFTTLFVDGNHENFTRLNAIPEIDMFGGKVGVVGDGIYHLKRGYVYTICGKTFFCFGGALSTDKQWRTAGISWWADETQTKAQEEFAFDQLEKVNYKVDFVVTHAAPKSIVSTFKFIDPERYHDPVAHFLNHLRCKIECKSWHFGHYHEDLLIEDKFYLHYNSEPFKVV